MECCKCFEHSTTSPVFCCRCPNLLHTLFHNSSMMGPLLTLDGSVLGPGKVLDWNEIPQDEVLIVGWIVMPLSTLCWNQLQFFINPPGGAVTIEADALLQRERVKSPVTYCIIIEQYMMCMRVWFKQRAYLMIIRLPYSNASNALHTNVPVCGTNKGIPILIIIWQLFFSNK